MKVDLETVAAAMQEAVDGARMHPDQEAAAVVNAVMERFGDSIEVELEGDSQAKTSAHKRLHAAADQLRDQGMPESAPLVNALIGIGLAILANGEDAEAFYAVFAAGSKHGT